MTVKSIRSAAALAELPNLSVVRFRGQALDGRSVWQLDNKWFAPGSTDPVDATDFPMEAFPAVVLWSPTVRFTKTCWRCGRVGKQQFGAAEASDSTSRWECSNDLACRRRTQEGTTTESYSRISNLAGANERRAMSAAQRGVEQARAVLALLTTGDLNVELPTNASRELWTAVLHLRANNETASLGELAAQMSPPMTKDRYTGLLRRACKIAAPTPHESASKPTKLADLIDTATTLHGGISLQKLASIAQQSGYPICGDTLRTLRDRPASPQTPMKRGPTRHVIRAIAFLAQAPESVVREAAGIPSDSEKKRSVAARRTRGQRDYQRKSRARTLQGADNRGRIWTTGEDQLMLAYMRDPAARINDLAKELGRSQADVTNRLQKLRSTQTDIAAQPG
ncbi:Uncharacterized protein conserved in bacteria [Mycobacteroides abscessus subsp. abscessus]|uniref:helix-turn-helix domain-containing protein n=1 Tax=Mycobacteroides abscessus TaxID=36809 RepID=UPI00092A2AFE|nr:helix-turn-helix domain-containing protein [Mycobacteroides abscessus]SIH26530.1 Uncharacterized protein conserved in bacteria [Mycobacteroides abscessus subsp. abscessus]